MPTRYTTSSGCVVEIFAYTKCSPSNNGIAVTQRGVPVCCRREIFRHRPPYGCGTLRPSVVKDRIGPGICQLAESERTHPGEKEKSAGSRGQRRSRPWG